MSGDNLELELEVEDQDMVNMFASVWVKVEQGDPTYDPGDRGTDESVNEGTSNCARKQKNRAKKKQSYYKRPTKLLECNECDFTTYYKNCLVIHVKTRHFNEYARCDQCEYVTDNNHALWRHKAIKHRRNDKQPPTFNGKELPELHCKHCDYKTYYKWNYSAHQRKHKQEKNYKCRECEYETAYRNNFVKHSKTHDEKHNVFYKCDKCPFVTKYAGHIQRHLAKIHNEVSEKDSFCDLCDFSTRVRWRLNIHKQKSKQETLQKCDYKDCAFETYYRCAFKKHKTSHYVDIYAKKVKIQRHDDMNEKIQSMATMDTKTGENNLEIIENSAATIDHIDNLYETAAADSDSSKTLIDAAKSLAEFSSGAIHNSLFQNIIDDSMYGECSFENVSKSEEDFFESSHTLTIKNLEKKKTPKGEGLYNDYDLDQDCEDQISIQVIETLNEGRRYQCQQCEYMSKFKAAVQRHFRRHHTGNTIRPYHCRNCDFTTKTKDQIGLHNKRSLCETGVTCPDCDFTTLYKCQLVMHQKTHYKYHCSKCTYSARKMVELTRHYAVVHLGNGVKCRFCDFKAARKESILCHEAIHTGEKPHKCEFCEYTTVRKSLLNIHMVKYHSELKRIVTVVNQSDLKDKIKNLQVKVPRYTSTVRGESVPVNENVLKICDERVSLSENRVLVGDKIITIDDKDHVDEQNVVSLMGMIGMDI